MDFQELNEKISSFDVNDIDWNNMGSWPVAGKAIFASIIFAAIVGAFYWFDIADKITAYDQLVNKESQLKRDYETKAFRVANMDAYREQLTEIEESFGSLLRQLPRDTEVPGLLEDITAAAVGAGLTINEIKLKPEVDTEFYTELPIDIDVYGEYHDFGAFVSAIAGLSRIVTLHDFTIEQKDTALNLKILAKTYRYNDESGKKSKKAKRKK